MKRTPHGRELLAELVHATGLPEELAKFQLESIVNRDGAKDISTLSLDDLREVLSRYTQDLFSDLAEGKIRPDVQQQR